MSEVVVFFPSKYSLDVTLRRGVLYAMVGVALALCICLTFLFVYPYHSSASLFTQLETRAQPHKRSFSYEMIGSGALELRQSHALGWVARLAEEIAVIAYNSRPDSEVQQAAVLLKLKQGKEQLTLSNGQILYLRESAEGRGLHASAEPTSLWVKPLILDAGSVLLEVGRTSLAAEEKGQFVASLQGMGFAAPAPFLSDLRSARFLPQDVFMQRYAGQEYGHWNQKGVLDVGSYALRVSAGDYLVYDNREWRVTEEIVADAPVAYVKSLSERGVEIDVWDVSGFALAPLKLEAHKQTHAPFGPESIPSAIRLRTGTQVSCVLGKRRLIVKQGDWLLKAASGWRHVRNAEEVQLYLQRRLRGDLFVCDAIEKDSQGKFLMKGNLFDEARSYVQPVSLPINSSDKQHKTSRKRRMK